MSRDDDYDPSANTFGAAYTLGERTRHLLFWQGLPNGERMYVSRVKEDIPSDDMAGLGNPGRKVYEWHNVWAPFFFLISRMLLNWVASGDLFLTGWHHGQMVFGTGFASESYTELEDEAVVMCEKNFKGELTNKSNLINIDCVRSDLSRLTAFKVISCGEFVVLSIGNTIVLVCYVVYLCGFGDALLSRVPGIFLILPKFTSKFSSLCFLQFLNLTRMRSLFVQGEWRFIVSIIRDTIFPCSDRGNIEAHLDTMEDFNPTKTSFWSAFCAGSIALFIQVVGVLSCVMTIGLSFQALLVKLTQIHFASVRNFYTWSTYEWVVVAGFLNQIAGLTFVDEIEIHRIMMFKLCGAKAKWSWNHCRVMTAYIRLLTQKVGDGWLLEQNLSRLKVVSVLASIDSATVQCLLLSSSREKKMIQEREAQFELFDRLSSMNTNLGAQRFVKLVDDRRKAFRHGDYAALKPLPSETGDVFHAAEDLLKKFKEERDLMLKSADDASKLSSATLRTIAQLQAHIEDLTCTIEAGASLRYD